MPIVVEDLSGIAEGIRGAGGALAQALEKRAEQRLTQQQRGALDAALQKADLSTTAGQQDFLRKYTQAGGDVKDALAVIKQQQPSELDKLLAAYGYGESQGQETPVPLNQRDVDGVSGNPITESPVQAQTKEIHPALRETPFNQVPDEMATIMAASTNPSTQKFGEALMNTRDQAFKRYDSERKYASQQTRKFTDGTTELRRTLPGRQLSVSQMKHSLLNRDEAAKTKDFWASYFMRGGSEWAERFLSPEGALLESAVKSFLIDDLAVVKGRPNQFLEQRIIASLPSLMKSDLANLTVLAGFELRDEFDKIKLETYDRLADFYMKQDGFLPANFESVVYQQMQPAMEAARDGYAYRIRTLQEQDQGIDKLANKKVVQGTPLTMDMMTHFVDTYGKDKAVERAKKLGYTIPTIEQYRRYTDAGS